MSELTLLRNVAPVTEAPSAQARGLAASRLADAIASASRAQHRRSRRLASAVALAATVAVAVAALTTLGTRATDAAAAAVLREAAAAARTQLALAPDQYLYVRSENAYLATRADAPSFSALVPHVRERWLGRDGGRLRETSGKPIFLSARDRARWVTAGRPPIASGDVTDMRLRSRVSALPENPGAAFAALEREAKTKDSSFAWAMFQLIGAEFREVLTTPAQRSALLAAAARVPGIELIGDVTDRAGRRGVAVAVYDAARRARLQLIVDPASGQLLGEEEVVLGGNVFGYPAGTVIGHTTYTHSAVVADVDIRPTP